MDFVSRTVDNMQADFGVINWLKWIFSTEGELKDSGLQEEKYGNTTVTTWGVNASIYKKVRDIPSELLLQLCSKKIEFVQLFYHVTLLIG